ncbi:hypothetical protein [Bacillus massiliigorillae]|uniref:hypothetical protein n=1 Tax=Bacillus massiliigorillae TaxID=1243664 RepID=UPI0003A6841F|nr:hypothetical protein [Bacillus massiliigorillae]
MDTLPKVQFIIQHSAEVVTKEAVISKSEAIDSCIEVNEYAVVQVKLISPADANAILKIETYDQNKVIDIRESDGEVTIMGGAKSEYMLVPGQYYFEVYANRSKYVAYYNVKSKDFSNEALANLRLQVEKMAKGLSYEYTKESFGVPNLSINVNPTILQIIYFVLKQKKSIQQQLTSITKDPITDLVGEYKVTSYSRKPNYRSLRWQATKGGRNTDMSQPRVHYEKHAQLSTANIENQWIRYIVKNMLLFVRELSLRFQEEVDSLTNELNQQRVQLAQIQSQKAINHPFGFERTLERVKREEHRVLEHIQVLKRKHKRRQKQQLLLKQYIYMFTKFDNTSWVQSISPYKPRKVSSRLLRDERYYRMYALYKDLIDLESKDNMSKFSGVQFRKTWQLFEYFSLGLVITILQENGYVWEEGWLSSKGISSYSVNTLPSNTTLRFAKPNSDYYIEVVYEGEVETAIIERDYSRYFSHIGRRPDIRITIYHLDGRLYSEKAGIIIESKCRRHLYLINEGIDPDVKRQLRDFKNLEYFDSFAYERNEQPVKTPIKQVIVIYPKQKGMDPVVYDYVYGEGIVYLQVEPNDPYSEAQPFGYDALKCRLDAFLSQVIK